MLTCAFITHPKGHRRQRCLTCLRPIGLTTDANFKKRGPKLQKLIVINALRSHVLSDTALYTNNTNVKLQTVYIYASGVARAVASRADPEFVAPVGPQINNKKNGAHSQKGKESVGPIPTPPPQRRGEMCCSGRIAFSHPLATPLLYIMGNSGGAH